MSFICVLSTVHSLLDSLRDYLIVEVEDSKGNHYGRVAQVATISVDIITL